jgi:dTDP-4-dehydrorhamnose reductase
MLGKALGNTLRDGHEVIGIDIDEFDLSDDSCIRGIARMQPEIVCHLAAFTDVDRCESDPEKAYRSNVVATRNVAVACREARSRIFYTSTDYVFDGKANKPYTEDARPGPLNMYGRTKLIGEWFVQKIVEDNCIVRSSWLFGEGGRNFVDTILSLSREKNSIDVVDDQMGNPTYARDLALALKVLIEKECRGIYHVTNNGSCTWYDFAVAICAQARTSGCTINRTKSGILQRPAVRPAYSALDNGLYAGECGGNLRSWQEALQDYLNRRSGGESVGKEHVVPNQVRS